MKWGDLKVDTIGKQILFSTVRITAQMPSGQSTGTGFILNMDLPDGRHLPLLVTNKHVVVGATQISVHFIARKPGSDEPDFGVEADLVVYPDRTPFIDHPHPQMDLCALPILPLLGDDASKIFYRGIPSSMLPSEELASKLDAIEDLTFVGYPNGYFDTTHRTPIIRRGITASPLALDYGGNPVFLVDGSVFGGSSGSPVFILNEGSYREGNALHVGSRIIFVGVLAATMVRHTELPLAVSNAPHTKLAQELNLGVAFNWTAISDMLAIVRIEFKIP